MGASFVWNVVVVEMRLVGNGNGVIGGSEMLTLAGVDEWWPEPLH